MFDLTGLGATSDQVNGDVLTLYNAADHALARLNFGQAITAGEFGLQSDPHGGVVINFV